MDTWDAEEPGPLGHAEAPYSQAGSLDRNTWDMEQLEFQYRPRTTGEE